MTFSKYNLTRGIPIYILKQIRYLCYFIYINFFVNRFIITSFLDFGWSDECIDATIMMY